jgi:hypothetical protein
MAVKEYTEYVHYGNGHHYYLLTIALPIECMPESDVFGRATALHTELSEHIEIFNIGNVVFTEKDEFLAIYQREGESDLYARPVDMFFGHTDANIKRFVEVEWKGDTND